MTKYYCLVIRLIIIYLSILANKGYLFRSNNIGDICTSDDDCNSGYSDDNMKCTEDNYCMCSDSEALSFDGLYTKPECDNTFLYQRFKCKEDGPKCKKNQHCNILNRCECNDGYIRIVSGSGLECKKGERKGIFEGCTQYGFFKEAIDYCDINALTICDKYSVCLCMRNYYYNYSLDQCMTKESYLEEHDLKEYRVKPGVYCQYDSDCIEGLDCKNYTCTCPSDCEYLPEDEVCFCGYEENEISYDYEYETSYSGPVLAGVFVGLVICIFWCHKINSTIKKFKKRNQDQRQLNSQSQNAPASAGDLYPLRPTLNPPSSSHHPSPRPSNQPSPFPSRGSSPTPAGPPLPYKTTSEQPPPYDPPPPYTLYPQDQSQANNTVPSTGKSLPPDSDLGALPSYPLNPSTNSTLPSYPINPSAPGISPTHSGFQYPNQPTFNYTSLPSYSPQPSAPSTPLPSYSPQPSVQSTPLHSYSPQHSAQSTPLHSYSPLPSAPAAPLPSYSPQPSAPSSQNPSDSAPLGFGSGVATAPPPLGDPAFSTAPPSESDVNKDNK